MANHQEKSSFNWSVCDDILRGLFKPTEYGRIILPFAVLRRLDCMLEPTKEEVYQLFEQYKDKVSNVSPIIQKTTGTPYFNTFKYDLQRLKGDPTNVLMNRIQQRTVLP